MLVPLQCEYYALEGLTHLMATIDRVKNGMNPDLEVEGVVLTMFDPRNNLAHQVADEVKKHFFVFESVIPRNVRLSEAPSHGKPRHPLRRVSRRARRATSRSRASSSSSTQRARSRAEEAGRGARA